MKTARKHPDTRIRPEVPAAIHQNRLIFTLSADALFVRFWTDKADMSVIAVVSIMTDEAVRVGGATRILKPLAKLRLGRPPPLRLFVERLLERIIEKDRLHAAALKHMS